VRISNDFCSIRIIGVRSRQIFLIEMVSFADVAFLLIWKTIGWSVATLRSPPDVVTLPALPRHLRAATKQVL
jgi:hypothetical protein